MIILGKGDWAISSDKYQWKLMKKTGIDKNGEAIYKSEYYFVTLPGLIKYLFELKLRESEYSSIEELLSNVEKIHEQIVTDFGSIERATGDQGGMGSDGE